MNLEETIKVFLLSKPNLRTRKTYQSCLIPMCEYINPKRPISEVNAMEVVTYCSKLYEKKYAPATIRKHVITIKAFFNFVVELGYIDRSPAATIKRPKIVNNVRNKAMTNDEYQTLLNYSKMLSPRNYALLLFFGDTGCREIALRRLRISDIDFKNQSAIVTGKGDKTRTVYFGELCRQALRRWLWLKPLGTSDYVFRQKAGNNGESGELKRGVLSQALWRMTKKDKLGLPRPLGSHSIRHKKGLELADTMTAPSIAQKVMGHSDVRTTMDNYYPNDDERVRQKMLELSEGYVPPSTEPKPDKQEPEKIIFFERQKRN